VACTPTQRDALHVFEELGTPLWANRARAELAELSASGTTNRDVAAKLGIRSRAELAPHMKTTRR
jgi:hypothetical protein